MDFTHISVRPGRLITEPPGKTEPAMSHGLHVRKHAHRTYPVKAGAVLILASPPVENANQVFVSALY